MKSYTKEQVTELAEKAKRLLNNSDFVEIFAEIKEEIFDSFCSTNILDTERREEIHKISYSIDLIKKKIETYISAEKLQNSNSNTE